MATDAVTQAQTDAKSVTTADHTKDQGADAAYKALMTDYQNYQKSGASTTDVQKYWGQVTTELTKSGVLPDVSVAWADNQLKQNTGAAGAIDRAGQGGFTKADLNAFAYETQGNSDPTKTADATFATSLAGQVDKFTGDGLKNFDGNLLNTSALESRESDISNANTNSQNQLDARTVQGQLFNYNGALLKSLDTASDPNSAPDGGFGSNDLTAWQHTYDSVTQNGKNPQAEGAGPYTAANAQYVKDVAAGKYSGQGVNAAGFGVSDLGQSGGYAVDGNFDASSTGKGYDNLVAAYTAAGGISKQSTDAVADPGTTTSAEGPTHSGDGNTSTNDHSSTDGATPITTKPSSDGNTSTNDHSSTDGAKPIVTTDSTRPVVSASTDSSQIPAEASLPAPTKDSQGRVTDVTYTTGAKYSFSYNKDGQLLQIESTQDGKKAAIKPNDDGTWTVPSGDGKSTKNVTDIGVNKTGNIIYKDADGQFSMVNLDGSADRLSPSRQSALEKAVQPYASAEVQQGDGTLRVAARALGLTNTDDPKVVALSDAIQKATGRPGDSLLVGEKLDLSKVNDPSLQALRSAAEQKVWDTF